MTRFLSYCAACKDGTTAGTKLRAGPFPGNIVSEARPSTSRGLHGMPKSTLGERVDDTSAFPCLNPNDLWTSIEDAIVKSIVSAAPSMRKCTRNIYNSGFEANEVGRRRMSLRSSSFCTNFSSQCLKCVCCYTVVSLNCRGVAGLGGRHGSHGTRQTLRYAESVSVSMTHPAVVELNQTPSTKAEFEVSYVIKGTILVPCVLACTCGCALCAWFSCVACLRCAFQSSLCLFCPSQAK